LSRIGVNGSLVYTDGIQFVNEPCPGNIVDEFFGMGTMIAIIEYIHILYYVGISVGDERTISLLNRFHAHGIKKAILEIYY
jgi:hypothetical protein